VLKSILYLGAEVGFEAAEKIISGRAKILNVPPHKEAIQKALGRCNAILDASMKVRITDAMIASANELEVISCATTGTDHIDRAELARKGIPVYTLREEKEVIQNLTPAAEFSWALLLACARKLPAAIEHVKSGGWTRELFPGVMLRGKQIGIIGCGRIGGWMARYAIAFGMETVGYDPYVKEFPPHVRPVLLDELLAASDFITVHVPLNRETEGLISESSLSRIKPGAILINTSRGEVLEEAALLRALEAGKLLGAGLDVLAGEPDIQDSPMIKYAKTHENLVITPHCAGFSPEAVAIVCGKAAEKILDYLRI
jgi:D-3-phosphoglycerate dehydrogenase